MNQVELLRTKLSPPLARASLVARQRLLRRLDDAFERSLTLLSAPAGFGKTTLLSAWITSLQDRESPSHAVAWFSLDEGDNDPVRFWRYVIAACQSIQTPIGASALSLLRGPNPLRLERVVTALLNDIIAVSQECVLIIEDYHLISSPQIHRSLSFLLEHLSANMHIVIATRNALLAAFEKERSTPAPLAHSTAAAPLPEPLSHHEQRVLRLLVAGLSNPEIANELVISINTVKTHVKNIYSKLNVNGRKEARDVARHLKLL